MSAFSVRENDGTDLLLLAVQDLHESLAKLYVECGVDDGVHSTVHISQPREGVVHFQRHVAASTVGLQDVSDEEGQPTYNENTWKRRLLVCGMLCSGKDNLSVSGFP